MKKYGIVYRLTNKINGKAYIGITCQTVELRFKGHKDKAIKERSAIQNAIKKYGDDAFLKEEIYIAFDKDELYRAEIELIAKFDTYNNGYNLTLGGGGIVNMPQEMKDRIAAKKRLQTPPMQGRKHKLTSKLKLSLHYGGNQILATNVDTLETFFISHAQGAKEYGFNPSLVCAVIKGKRPLHKRHKFQYVNTEVTSESNKSETP